MSALAQLGKAALPSLPVVNQLPGIRKVRPEEFSGVTVRTPAAPIDPAHVARYAEVCGFPRKDTAPVTYPHLLTFDAQMEVMASPDFPWAPMGSVHLENTITSHRPVATDEVLGVEVSVTTTRPHAKGTVVDFVSTVTSGSDVVWESVSAYLVRGRGSEDAPPSMSFETPEGRIQWRLDEGAGRRYGAVSGDLNPIHLYPWTARALGFKRQIAHGMWTLARCVAAIENRLPDAVTIEAAFKKPIFLPSTVAYGVNGSREDWRFALRNPRDGSPHVLGRATAR
ncbi:MaoC/PaaZ C-terminal domain-containing protein [Nocardioides jishulii]|uniref:MaoC-like domain-containing protein n=1 Tax=Nocardioides jishulii TaxID=2575440 RepID=A0A4U2YPK6_9ACTN|nr:MaoC/PaaZ C-terminal domain-containing protein [Nocardioides jishulii]QCX27284.1 hypothetical protein FCL41_06910 [Nocardioides jishulii]TKI61771.1 hypothetical protein FC770_13550 [Nocardioides jishulii]